MNLFIELNFITGFAVGIEWHPMGSVDDEIGYVVMDLGIIRLLFGYQ